MAIFVGTDLQMTVKNTYQAQQIETVWSYHVQDAPIGVGVTAPELAQAWWNHVKNAYRAIVPVGFAAYFFSVECRVVNNPLGDFGEYDIPVGEQVGTRANPTQAEVMPGFVCAGVKLTVGTRATRPGQKRFSVLMEGDQNASALQPSITTPLNALMTLMTADLGPLGAPAVAFNLRPMIFRLGPGESLINSQRVVGHVLNPYVTSQVSRKIGHGV